MLPNASLRAAFFSALVCLRAVQSPPALAGTSARPARARRLPVDGEIGRARPRLLEARH
jgi:hypothetical protein